MYISPDHRNWETIIPFFTFAYTSLVQRTTGYSPLFLVYGRQPSFALDTAFFSAPVSAEKPFHEQLAPRITHCRPTAIFHPDSNQQQRKARCDASHRSFRFCTEDEVLLYTPIQTSCLCEKYIQRYLGPYVVVERVSPVNYRASPVDIPRDRRCRGTETMHVSRLNRFNRRQSQPPAARRFSSRFTGLLQCHTFVIKKIETGEQAISRLLQKTLRKSGALSRRQSKPSFSRLVKG